ncbi:serine/threonine-protein kinase MARK2 [Puma concolor]|uniref:Serine/threonine-protein kinase MARK2 n=1 Tax=Puma concolor TaxID=9696 RepID=A0A6P6H5V9_PUMCO|nr:serine/threonine-protein kinase MARK2 [Puma concolor]
MLRGRNSAASADEQPHIGNYRLLKTIGKGNFAKVKLARHILTGKEVAVKIIDKTQLNSSSLQKLFREVRIMKVLNHPNIVKLFEVIETEKTLYLVMEYASGGEVFDYLVAHGRMKEKEARAKFRQIVSAVQYCHQKFIVHRDLKAENLLLDADMNIKIADFGFSNEFTFGNKLDTFCGSPPYAAPELFQGKKYDGPEVDVWSLGVILYTLVSGSLPFDGQNLKELRERVLRGKYRIPFYMSTDCENLLKKFLILNPSKRGTLEQIMKDRWMNVGHEDDELKPYVEPLPDYKDPRRTELMVSMGYTREEIQDSLVGQRYNEVMATYLLLGYKSSELEGDTITLKPRPSADLTNSNAPSPSHKVQRSVSANPKQRRFSDQGCHKCSVVMTFFTAPQRVPVASPSAHNISSSGGAPDRTNFPRGVSSRSTFHAGQLRQVRDQQNLPYGVTPASPSGNSQGRRGASGSIFSKFTSKFVRRNLSFRFARRNLNEPESKDRVETLRPPSSATLWQSPARYSNKELKGMLVWSPNHCVSDAKLDKYIAMAKEKHGYNIEQALGMLLWHKHDVEKSLADLANFTPFPDEWTVEDKVLFEQAFGFHGKCFQRIQQMLPDKLIPSLVKYYYSWKKTRSRTSVMDRQARRLGGRKDKEDRSISLQFLSLMALRHGHASLPITEPASKLASQPPLLLPLKVPLPAPPDKEE